jgi:hypothetical protein
VAKLQATITCQTNECIDDLGNTNNHHKPYTLTNPHVLDNMLTLCQREWLPTTRGSITCRASKITILRAAHTITMPSKQQYNSLCCRPCHGRLDSNRKTSLQAGDQPTRTARVPPSLCEAPCPLCGHGTRRHNKNKQSTTNYSHVRTYDWAASHITDT